jgi:PAS domain S-box-containing protein
MSANSELGAALSVAESSLLDAILGTTRSIAVIADADGVILRVSRFSSDLCGWETHELEGLTLGQFVAKIKPSNRKGRCLMMSEVPIVRALNGECVTACEGAFLHRNGELVPVTIDAAPFNSSDGRVIGAVTALTDLRKFETIEHRLQALYNDLARHIRSVSGS